MNALAILGLRPGDTLKQAKERYHALALRFHPDKNPLSAENQDRFLQVKEAYEKIRADVSLLSRTIESDGLPSYLEKPIEITLEDIYYAREKKISLQRSGPCSKCLGTGSELGPGGLCGGCNGAGIIKSSVLDLMNMSNTCPTCSGLGYLGRPCPSCLGTKVKEETVDARFRVNLRSYYRKAVVLPGYGNIQPDGVCEDLILRLKIQAHPFFYIEDKNFCVSMPVLPVQKVLGDRATINVFGRKLVYTILPNSTEAYVIDEVREGLRRSIRVKFVDIAPLITPETKELYEKILKLEKPVIQHTAQSRSTS